jgi:hypothetical protein
VCARCRKKDITGSGWHKDFYFKLNRNDGKGTCCNLMDCRPTPSRMVGDHYEVKVDGEWTPVPNDKINNVVAPDGGAHVCAPRQVGPNKGVSAQGARKCGAPQREIKFDRRRPVHFNQQIIDIIRVNSWSLLAAKSC